MWVRSDTFSIISHSIVWYNSRNKCVAEVRRHQPSVDVCGNSPTPLLLMQSVCQCISTPPTQYRPTMVCNHCLAAWTPQNQTIRECCSNTITYLPELLPYHKKGDEDSVSMHFKHVNMLPGDPLARECSE